MTLMAIKSIDDSFLREEFLHLQRKFLTILFGDEKAATEDYYLAGGPRGTFASLLSPKPFFEFILLQELFDSSIRPKIKSRYFKIPGGNLCDEEKEFLKSHYLLFNPNIIYSHFMLGYRISLNVNLLESGQDEQPEQGDNFFYLQKSDISDDDENKILERASLLSSILGYSRQYYETRNERDPWSFLRSTCEELIAKIDPSLKFDFVLDGVVRGFHDDPHYDGVGYTFNDSNRTMVILKNTADKEKFNFLMGKRVKYILPPDQVYMYFLNGKLVAVP